MSLTAQQRASLIGLSLVFLLSAPTGVATNDGRAQLLSAYAAFEASVLDLKCTSSVPLWRPRTSESLMPDRIAVSGMPTRTSDCNCDC